MSTRTKLLTKAAELTQRATELSGDPLDLRANYHAVVALNTSLKADREAKLAQQGRTLVTPPDDDWGPTKEEWAAMKGMVKIT